MTSGNTSGSNTNLSATGDITTVANTLVVVAAALHLNTVNFGATWTNADLANIVERVDVSSASGNTGRLGVVTGEKANAGTYAATTNTLTTNGVKAMMTIALRPLPIQYSRDISDSLTVSDSITRAKGNPRSIADSVAISPSVTGQITGVGRGLVQGITVSDSISANLARNYSLPNSISISDSIDRNVTVTPDTNVAGMAYASSTGNGLDYPKYREWNPTTKSWGAEVELESAGSPVRTAWIEFSPVSTKRVIVVLSEDGTIDTYACDFACTTAGNWVVNHDIVDLWSTAWDIQKRPFDMEYENTSGDLMLVYDKADGGNPDTDLFYRIMPDSATAFGSEQALNDGGSTAPDNIYSFVRLDSRKTSNSNDLGLIALSETNNRAVAWYWNGATETFGNELTLSTSMSTNIHYEAIGIGFETHTGDMVVVAGEGSSIVAYEFSGGSWSQIMGTTSINVGTVRWIRFVANKNPGTTSIMLAVSGSFNDLDTSVWTGTAWQPYNPGAPLFAGSVHDSNIDTISVRAFDWAWDNAGDATRGVLVWSTDSGVISYKRFTLTNTWTQQLPFADDGATHGWVSLNEHSNPTSADQVSVLGAVIDADSDISQVRWDGSAVNMTSWTNDGATTSGRTDSESFHVDFRRSAVLKKFMQETITVTDSINAQLTSQNIPDTLTVTDSIVAEKGSPTDSSRFGAVYRSNTGGPLLNSPKYREWDPLTQTWNDEVVLPNTGSPVRDAQIRFSPSSSLRVVVSHSDSGALNLFACDNNCISASSWTLLYPNFADTGTPAAGEPYKPYDIMFETTGERLIIVYDKEGTADSDFYYRTFDGTTLSEETGVNLGGSSDNEELRYLNLAAHPTTNEMALAVLDATNSKSYGVIWNGSSWGNVQTVSSSLSTENKDGESVGVAYQTSSGVALVFSGNGTNSAAYARWTGSWTGPTTTNPNTDVTTEDVKFVSLKSNPAGSSNDIMVCQSDDESDLSCSEFVAGSPGTWNTITSNTGTTQGRAFDFAYRPSNGKGMLVSSSGASGTLDYRVWDGTNIGGPAVLSVAGTHKWVFGLSAAGATDVVNGLFLKSNSNFDTGGIKYKADIATLIGDAALTANSSNDTFESMNMDIQRSKVVKRQISSAVTIADSITLTPGRMMSETVAVADEITKSVTRLVSDSVSLGDTATVVGALRNVVDSVSVSDAVTSSISRFISDSVVVIDAITPTTIRSITTVLNLADAISTHVTRSLSDTITVTDAADSTTSRPLSDAISIADAITMHVSRFIADSLSITEAVNRSISRSVSDSIGVEDAISPNTTYSVTDGITLSDSMAMRVSRSVSDSLSVIDAIERNNFFAASPSDTLTIADSVSTAVSRSMADSVSVADAITTSAGRSPSESLVLADAISMSVTRSISEILTVTDVVSPNSIRNISETLAITDTILHSASLLAADSVTVSDSITISVTRSIEDSVSLTDAATHVPIRVISEMLSIADAVAMSVSRSIAETLEIEDSATPTVGIVLQETLTTADVISMRLTRVLVEQITAVDTVSSSTSRSVSDSITVTDSISVTTSRPLSDAISIADAITMHVSRSATDTVELTDAVSSSVSRTIADTIGIADTVTSTAGRPTADSVTIGDMISTSVTRSLSDSVSVTDAVSSTASRLVAETLTVTDAISQSVSRSLADSVTLADSISAAVSRSLADSLALTDAITTAVTRSMSETLGLTDTITPSVNAPISETVTITDTISTSVSRSIADTLGVADSVLPTVTVTVSDAITVTDAITTTVSRALEDEMAITDVVNTAVTRSVADNLAVTDAVSGSPAPAISESLSVADSITMSVSRSIAETLSIGTIVTPESAIPISETLTLADVISIHMTRTIAEELTVAEYASTGAFALLLDDLTMNDAISMSVTRSVNDSITVEDLVAMSIALHIEDSLDVSDGATAIPGYAVSLAETITIGDIAERPFETERFVVEALTVADMITTNGNYFRAIEEVLTVGDTVSTNGSIIISNSLDVSDAISIHVTRSLADVVVVTDAASAGSSVVISDSVSTADTIAVHLTRVLAETISIADLMGPIGPQPFEDSIGITDVITNVSVHWNRNFDEELGFGECTPFACDQSPRFDEGLLLADELILPPQLVDMVAVTDAIVLGLKVSSVPPVQDSVTVADSVTGTIIGILVVDDKYAIGPLPSTSVSGTYTYTGNATNLINQMTTLPIPINSTEIKSSLPSDITILRTYHVPVTWSPEIPGEHVIVSEIHKEMPEKSNMFMRINFEETPQLSGNNFIKTLDIEFAPNFNTTNFALVVSLMDGPPAPGGMQSPTPTDSIRPIYLDVKWIGNFPGEEDPSVREYYLNPPTFTFTVNEEWVESEGAMTNENGVPLLKLWLLNEGLNEWEPVNDILPPDEAIDDTYTFVATLEHFSDYAITANTASSTPGSGGGGGGGSPPVPTAFTVNLIDAIGLSEASTSQALEIIDEFVNEKFTALLLDSVAISSKPVAYNTFQILKEVEVSITVVDVQHESTIPPSATALLETLIVNKGDVEEEFTLNFWYNDQTGARKFDLSLFVEVDPHESKTIPVEIPFTEPGTFRVTAEARGVPGNELLESTQLTVIIPWLAVYLYVLISVAVAILGGSGMAIALYLARNATLIAAGAGAAGAAIILAKRNKPRVRVTEWKEGAEDDDYDLMVNVTLANGTEGRLAKDELIGAFEFEIVNKSRSKQEFVLAYYLEDVAGIRAPEAAGIVKIDKHKKELRRDRIALPSRGAYVLCVEARTHKGEVLSSDRVPVRSV
ncbi:hypothetical protein [Candidatus Nitrososphaera sp. FF02]|uniref:hypothetical protein n=1 Tax=Candidatus Nitrososphaera sp. FF02 TaxID=3398226 RepID=UPI0039E7D46A